MYGEPLSASQLCLFPWCGSDSGCEEVVPEPGKQQQSSWAGYACLKVQPFALCQVLWRLPGVDSLAAVCRSSEAQQLGDSQAWLGIQRLWFESEKHWTHLDLNTCVRVRLWSESWLHHENQQASVGPDASSRVDVVEALAVAAGACPSRLCGTHVPDRHIAAVHFVALLMPLQARIGCWLIPALTREACTRNHRWRTFASTLE